MSISGKLIEGLKKFKSVLKKYKNAIRSSYNTNLGKNWPKDIIKSVYEKTNKLNEEIEIKM